MWLHITVYNFSSPFYILWKNKNWDMNNTAPLCCKLFDGNNNNNNCNQNNNAFVKRTKQKTVVDHEYNGITIKVCLAKM